MGTKIKELREQSGMTQEELSHKADISRATLCEIENNPQKMPTVRTLKKLAKALGVSLDRIFFAEDA
jgi:transcriptional regulator with XRE-family HTH domain